MTLKGFLGGELIPCHKAGIVRTGLEHSVKTTKQGYFKECQGQGYKDRGAGQKELPLTKLNQSAPSEKNSSWLSLWKARSSKQWSKKKKEWYEVYKKEVVIQRENKTCIIICIDLTSWEVLSKYRCFAFSVIVYSLEYVLVSILYLLHICYRKE